MRKIIIVILIVLCAVIALPSLSELLKDHPEESERLPVKVLILPKFEVDQMSGDFPGEAQYYYEHYLMNAEEYDIPEGNGGKLYYRDGIAMYVLGFGKVGAALNTMAVLSDSRFDFSDAYILSTGCAGSAAETTVMGDVFVISAAVDYDLGHHADSREIADPEGTTWFHDADYDSEAVTVLNAELMDQVFSIVKDTPILTTEKTRNYMRAAFDGAEWALRDPKVMRGTTVSSDNYWKGSYDHANALLITETYQCPDPYVTTEMEDSGVARAVKRMGMLDRLIILRGSVNMDVFMLGNTPETLWGDAEDIHISNQDNVEAADIFAVSMENTYKVGRIIIDTILSEGF